MTKTAFVLIADGDVAHGDAMATSLKEHGFACHLVSTAEDARASIARRAPDVLVTATNLDGGACGADVLEDARRASADTEVILVLDQDEGDASLSALARGSTRAVYDCVRKPVEPASFRRLVSRAAGQSLAARGSRACCTSRWTRRSSFPALSLRANS